MKVQVLAGSKTHYMVNSEVYKRKKTENVRICRCQLMSSFVWYLIAINISISYYTTSNKELGLPSLESYELYLDKN